MEYNLYVKIDRDYIHILNYIVEAEDNIMNVRNYENGVLKIIIPASLYDYAINLLENIKKYIPFEITGREVNKGFAN